MNISWNTSSFKKARAVGLRVLACGAVLLLLDACSLEASIDAISKEITTVFSKTTVTEVTAGSSQNSYTTRGYKIQASVSYQESRPEGVTARGYKVKTNTQGTLFKE